MQVMTRLALLLTVLLAACDSLPRDQEGTLDHIREKGIVRVGIVASAAPPHYADRLQALIERAAGASGGRAEIVEEASEPLLMMLEAGEVDLVVGEFDRSSPWSRRVHLLPPLVSEAHGKSQVEATAAARNGENAWIMLLEREAKALSGAQ